MSQESDAIEKLIGWHTDRLGLELRAQAKQARDQLERLKAAAADTDILRADRDRTQENYLKVVARLSALEADKRRLDWLENLTRANKWVYCPGQGFYPQPAHQHDHEMFKPLRDCIDAALARDQKEGK